MQQFRLTALMADIQIAEDHARTGDLDAAIELSRAIVKRQFETGEMAHRGPVTSVLVETLLRRHRVTCWRQRPRPTGWRP